jgi:hypothetical protein
MLNAAGTMATTNVVNARCIREGVGYKGVPNGHKNQNAHEVSRDLTAWA